MFDMLVADVTNLVIRSNANEILKWCLSQTSRISIGALLYYKLSIPTTDFFNQVPVIPEPLADFSTTDTCQIGKVLIRRN